MALPSLNVLGLMSGTSLDGLDISLVAFQDKSWELQHTKHVAYNDHWKTALSEAHKLSGEDLVLLDIAYGQWLGEQVNRFQKEFGASIDLVSSHGHTVFHQPEKRLTHQIGNGNALHIASGYPVICDFRSADVMMGGQGAPLVPRGDLDLFPHYDGWLNLGGMANVTVRYGSGALAWDLVPCNTVFNHLSARVGAAYDKDGAIAKRGRFVNDLAKAIESLPYFKAKPPKSLGREWVEQHIFPLLEGVTTEDAMQTCVQVFAKLIDQQLPSHAHAVLVSGGGVYNRAFMDALDDVRPACFVAASNAIVEYKESIVFAYLGYLRVNGKNNILNTVTGAPKDHSAGVLFSKP